MLNRPPTPPFGPACFGPPPPAFGPPPPSYDCWYPPKPHFLPPGGFLGPPNFVKAALAIAVIASLASTEGLNFIIMKLLQFVLLGTFLLAAHHIFHHFQHYRRDAGFPSSDPNHQSAPHGPHPPPVWKRHWRHHHHHHHPHAPSHYSDHDFGQIGNMDEGFSPEPWGRGPPWAFPAPFPAAPFGEAAWPPSRHFPNPHSRPNLGPRPTRPGGPFSYPPHRYNFSFGPHGQPSLFRGFSRHAKPHEFWSRPSRGYTRDHPHCPFNGPRPSEGEETWEGHSPHPPNSFGPNHPPLPPFGGEWMPPPGMPPPGIPGPPPGRYFHDDFIGPNCPPFPGGGMPPPPMPGPRPGRHFRDAFLHRSFSF